MNILSCEEMRKSLINLRKKHSLTQKGLSLKTSISQSLISKYEKGLIDPAYSKIKILYDYLNSLEIEETLEDYANFNLVSIKSNDTITKAKKLMIKHNVDQLPVFDNDNMVGSVNIIDLIDCDAKFVREIMRDPFPFLPLNTDLKIVKMVIKNNRSAVITKKGKKFGIITSNDLV
jgi:predicted transcriptional regulator